MNFIERKEIIEYFNSIEGNNSTETWIYKGIKCWPIIKISLFLKLFWTTKADANQNLNKFNLLKKVKVLLKRKISAIRIRNLKLSQVDCLFFSGTNFRESFLGESYNKFFDPIGDKLEKDLKSFYFFEYGPETKEKKYQNRGVNIQTIYPFFEEKFSLQAIDYSNWSGFDEFESFIERINLHISVKSETQMTLNKVFAWAACFTWILERTNPKKIFLLSYYNIPCLGLLVAAKIKGIECIDIQHGSQGEFHPAYSGFKENYSLLPDLFWLWDEDTEAKLKENFGFTDFRTLIGGNPWHYFLRNKNFGLELKKPSILFTLQPLSPILDKYVLDSIIRTKDTFDWLLRLHPRIDNKSKLQLISLLKSLGIFEKGLWHLANETPLPFLFKKVDLHISKFSGCISEAADLGTFSIILEEIGETTYSHLIDEGLAIGSIDYSSDNLLSAIRSNLGKRELEKPVDLRMIINQVC